MADKENKEKVNELYKSLCSRYEQFKTAHFACLDKCENSSVKDSLEESFKSQRENFDEFREHFSTWNQDCDNVSVIESVTSSRTQLLSAKIKRMVAENKMKTLRGKMRLEQEQREIENKKQLLDMESEIEEARIEESVWEEEENENVQKTGNTCEAHRDVDRRCSAGKETIPLSTSTTTTTQSEIDLAFNRLANTLQEGFNLPKPEILTFNETSDISSGYNSIEDLCSISSEESRGIILEPIKKQAEPEVMKFRSVRPLCDNLKLILSMPELCDVTFLVGAKEIPVHGVKAILGTRSRKFYEVILKHQTQRKGEDQLKRCPKKKMSKVSHNFSDKIVIPVKKYDEEVFRSLIQFVHCGSVNVTENTVAGLYCGACQFELPDLAQACLDFIERCVTSGNFETLLYSTRNYSHHGAAKTLFDKIYSVLDKRYKKYGEVSV